MQILIAGDLVPTKSNKDFFNHADTKALLGEELLSIWNSADIRIFNLEVPLTDTEDPIDKCGPNLIAPTSVIKGIKALEPSLLTLANNHIFDQGEQGLQSTIKVLNKNNIPYVGVGENLTEASEPYIIEKDGFKIGIYACAEHEFSIAGGKTPGANLFDPLESLDHIQELKARCDYVLILYHGGKEHYRYPSPYLQKVCRGADLVVCQHCIRCIEQYKGFTIVYRQGNFIFNSSKSEYWNTSILIKLEINYNQVNVEYIPFTRNGNGVLLVTGKIAEEILGEFQHRTKEILQEGFIEKQYQEFAQANIQFYLGTFSGFGKWILRINGRLLNRMLINVSY